MLPRPRPKCAPAGPGGTFCTMATTPPDDELPLDEQPDEQTPDEQAPDEAVPRGVQVALSRMQQRMLREFMGQKEQRQDVAKNRAKIRRVMLDYIKNELRSPTVQEICEATGLSDKTVKSHKRHIKLGDGKANIYQDLTPDVMMALYKNAKGFTYQAEKLLTVSAGAGAGSEVERHEVRVFVKGETAAAKLWLSVVEGHSEITKTEHSGEVKTGAGGGFYFEYVVPEAPKND
jgi:hypothetical protein